MAKKKRMAKTRMRKTVEKQVPPFTQITVSSGGVDTPDFVYGLDEDGRIWRFIADKRRLENRWEMLATKA